MPSNDKEIAALQEEIGQLRSANARLATLGESQFRELFDFMPQLGWTAQPDGFIDFYNRGWYEYTGTTLEQMQGWGWKTVHDPEMLPLVIARWQQSLSAGTPFEMEFPLRRHDGQFRWHLTRVSPMREAAGTIIRWVGINTDIDDRVRSARGAEELHAATVKNMAEGVCLVRVADNTLVYTNPAFDFMFGYGFGELNGRPITILNFADTSSPPQQKADLAEAQRRDEGVETRNVRKDGTAIWCRARTSEFDHPEHGLVRVSIYEDITERRRNKDELDQFFKMSLDLLCIAGLDGHFKRLNPSWTLTLGWSEEELLARPWLDFVHPDDREQTLKAGGQLSAGSLVVSFTNRYECKDGTYRWIEWRCAPELESGRIYGAARDISARREAEEARDRLQRHLIVADRMISVGTLAAGVAHEINNPLSYVTSNIDVAVEEIRALSGGSPSGRMKELEEMLVDARQGAERVKKIVRGLKTFSRTDSEHRAVIDLKSTLGLAINMAFNEIRHRARLVKDYGKTPLVEADDARLGQVFINLLVNAAQAIPEGQVDANEIRIVTATNADGRAIVEVRDTGPGIPQAVIERIFDPFFTTKPVGVGTGLGLAICHNIVTGMGGEISVSSEAGRGATFRVTLPAAAVQTPTGLRNASRPKLSIADRGAVLIVDDEPAVGVALRRVLRDHEVTIVTTGREALELLESGKHFDVILSDLMMPQMSGMDLYAELARRSPADAGKMVFVSGGAFTPAAGEFLSRVANERIEKPFDPEVVRALVWKFVKGLNR